MGRNAVDKLFNLFFRYCKQESKYCNVLLPNTDGQRPLEISVIWVNRPFKVDVFTYKCVCRGVLIDNLIRQSASMDTTGFAQATNSSEAIRDTSAVIKSHTLASGEWQEEGGGE